MTGRWRANRRGECRDEPRKGIATDEPQMNTDRRFPGGAVRRSHLDPAPAQARWRIVLLSYLCSSVFICGHETIPAWPTPRRDPSGGRTCGRYPWPGPARGMSGQIWQTVQDCRWIEGRIAGSEAAVAPSSDRIAHIGRGWPLLHPGDQRLESRQLANGSELVLDLQLIGIPVAMLDGPGERGEGPVRAPPPQVGPRFRRDAGRPTIPQIAHAKGERPREVILRLPVAFLVPKQSPRSWPPAR